MLLAVTYSKKGISHHDTHTNIKLKQTFHEIIHIHVMLLFFCFLGLHLWHLEVPRLGVESEL